MHDITISHIRSTSARYAEVLELREEMLRKPLGLSLKNEDLSRDHTDTIFIAVHNDKVIACLLLHHIDNDVIQLRAMAVYREWQGKGIGAMLVAAAEKFCSQNGYHKVILHSRKVATGFYKSMGYGIISDEFTEVGIPHYIMEKGLRETPGP
jgi:predicted GNAT family N-acyltransferase